MSDLGKRIIELVENVGEPLRFDEIGRRLPHLLLAVKLDISQEQGIKVRHAFSKWWLAIVGWCEQRDPVQREAAERRKRIFIHIEALLKQTLRMPEVSASNELGPLAWLERWSSVHSASILRVPIAVDWEDRGEVGTLELLLHKAPSVTGTAVGIHPADEFLFAGAYGALARDMHRAFDVACRVSNRNPAQRAYWRFADGQGNPLVTSDWGPPLGDSATGAAFYGWSKLLDSNVQRKRPGGGQRLTELALARLGSAGDLEGFVSNSHDTVSRESLQRKARAIAKDGTVARIITASEIDARTVHESLEPSERARIQVGHV